MGQKTWDTLSEDALQKCVAAWAWLHTYTARRLGDQNLKISHARWSKLVAPCVVIMNGAQAYASLGNAVWAVLACPLQSKVVNNVTYFYFADSPKEWLHIAWQVREKAVLILPDFGFFGKQQLRVLREEAQEIAGELQLGPRTDAWRDYQQMTDCHVRRQCDASLVAHDHTWLYVDPPSVRRPRMFSLTAAPETPQAPEDSSSDSSEPFPIRFLRESRQKATSSAVQDHQIGHPHNWKSA